MKNLISLFLIAISFTSFAQSSQYDLFIQNGLGYLGKNQYQQAMVEFQKAYNLDSTKVESYYYTGVTITNICFQTGESCQGAIEMLTTSININPNFRKAYYNRGVCLLRIGYLKDAINDFNNAIKLDNQDPDYFINRGLAKIKLKEKEEGCIDFKKALKLGSNKALKFQKEYCH